MKALKGALRGLFSRTSKKPDPVVLPEEIRRCLAEGKSQAAKSYIQAILLENKHAPEFDHLLAEANRLKWSSREIEKLQIFGHFYRGDHAQALRALKYAEGADFDLDFLIIAAASLYDTGQPEEAYQLLASEGKQRQLLADRKDYPLLLAVICWATARFDEMKQAIDEARRIDPESTLVALNAYAFYFELGEMEALACLRREFDEGRYSTEFAGNTLAFVELAQNNFVQGFELLDLRYKREESRYLDRGLASQLRWQGESLAGKTLLVSVEEGLGDTVQMARYLPMLALSGVEKVIMETQPETLPLLHHNFPNIDFVARDSAKKPNLNMDLWVSTLGLPHIFGTVPENVPGKAGYLTVPNDNTGYWCERVANLATGKKLRIGLAWSGNPRHHADRRRSIPFQRMMDSIRAVDADFFALQTHVPVDHPDNLIDVSGEMVTLADTAALIAEMDLVITVDTSVVHVAGAIGKETWLLLPYRYEWRWGLAGESNHWYDSVKILRQCCHGDWEGLLDVVFNQRLPERFA